MLKQRSGGDVMAAMGHQTITSFGKQFALAMLWGSGKDGSEIEGALIVLLLQLVLDTCWRRSEQSIEGRGG